MAKFAKIAFRKKGQDLGLLRRPDGSPSNDPDQVIDTLFEVFFNGSVKADLDVQPKKESAARSVIDLYCNYISTEKVKEATKSFGKFKTPGPDGFHPIVLQNLDKLTLNRLAKLFRACVYLGYTPRAWRKSKIIFIPKLGKDDYSDAKSFRPISLTSFIFKTMERVIVWYLEELMQSNLVSPISKMQHAFKRGFSTQTALTEVCNYIESGILRGQFVLGVSLDIQGAFDNLLPEKAKAGMLAKRFPEEIIEWYHLYLTGRVAKIAIRETKQERQLIKGCSQGSILSPLLWNLTFDSFLDLMNEGPMTCIGYADDAFIMVTGPDPATLISITQASLNKAMLWGKENGLEFSAEKTKAIMFQRKKWKPSDRHNLQINGKAIRFVDKLKYLGLTITPKLTWSEHIKDRIAKGKWKLMQLRAAVGVIWGPSPRAMLWVYKCIVVPAVLYGATIWAAKGLKAHEKRLQKLNRLAMWGLGPMRPSTPTAGLEIILGVPPLDLEIKKEGLRTFLAVKDKVLHRWDGLGHKDQGFLKTWESMVAKENLEFATEDKGILRFNWVKPFKWDCTKYRPFDAFIIKEKTNLIVGRLKGHLPWLKIENNGNQTQAMLGAIEHLAYDLGVQVVALGVSLPHCLAQNFLKSQPAAVCINKLQNRGEGNGILFRAITKNEKIAIKRQRQNFVINQMTRDPVVPPGHNAAKLKEWLYETWKSCWLAQSGCRQTKAWFKEPQPEISKEIIKKNRMDLGTFVQFLSGHGWLMRHRWIIDPECDPLCRLCLEEEEEPIHIFWSCPAVARDRMGWIEEQEALIEGQNFHWNLKQVSRCLKAPSIAELFGPEE